LQDAQHGSGVTFRASDEGYAWRAGALLYWRRWQAAHPRATAVVVHGLCEHAGRYGELACLLAAWGIETFAADGRGFGRSSGPRGDWPHFGDRLDDVAWGIVQQRARHPGRPLVLFGHSMGGLIATRYVQSDRPRPDLLVLSGPAIDPRETDRRGPSVALARLGARVLPGLRIPFATFDGLSTDPAVAAAARADPLWVGGLSLRLGTQMFEEMARAWEELAAIRLPVLLLHGADDPLVPAAASRDGAARVGSVDVTVRVYPGYKHEVYNERRRELVFADLKEGLDRRLPQRPA
jgi:alpha-beta hydrolase superfamily lysophospholipase